MSFGDFPRRARQPRACAGEAPAEIKLEIERLVDAICAGAATPATQSRLVTLEREKAALEQDLARLDAADRVVDVHPGALESYRRMPIYDSGCWAFHNLGFADAASASFSGKTAAGLRQLLTAFHVTRA